MLRHRGFSCWINCDDEPLQVYQPVTDDDAKIAWVASEGGKNFSVCWQDNSEIRIASSGHVFIDGKDVASAIIRPGRTTHVERSGVKKGPRSIQLFAFSELSLTDDDRIANKKDKSLADVGEIKVEIKLVKLGGEVAFEGYDARNVGVVHEQAKKAGAQCTRFQMARRSDKARTVAVSTAPYDEDNPGAYVTFLFRYRDREMLKAMGIIDNGLKRPATDEVIQINSDTEDDETSSSSPTQRADHLPKKRVKTEQPDDTQLPPGPDIPPIVTQLDAPKSQTTVEESQESGTATLTEDNVDQLSSDVEEGSGREDENGGLTTTARSERGPPTSSPPPETEDRARDDEDT